jgi:hypothetical protein
MGGILVNTSFGGGVADVVIGTVPLFLLSDMKAYSQNTKLVDQNT